MNYQTPDHWSQPIEDMLAPYGDKGAALASAIAELAIIQHDALIGKRLAPYLEGVDFLFETGWANGIISQPPRPTPADVAAMTPDARAAFAANVLDPLDQFAAATDGVASNVDGIGLDADDPWLSEIIDGVAVDAARVHFVAAVYRAAVDFADGKPTDALLAAADDALARAKKLVAHRHAHLHDPEPARLTAEDSSNVTVYHYGYLWYADTLCYWERERTQARNLVLGTSDMVPGCVLGF